MVDDLDRRCNQLKTTSMEDSFNGKITLMEDNLKVRQLQWKMVLLEDDLSG